MLWSAKRYWQIFTDKREKKPSEKHKVAKPPSVFHEVFSRVWSEYLKFCWAKLSILPLFLVFWSPQPTVMNTGKYPTLLSVLWRRKTWNSGKCFTQSVYEGPSEGWQSLSLLHWIIHKTNIKTSRQMPSSCFAPFPWLSSLESPIPSGFNYSNVASVLLFGFLHPFPQDRSSD